MDSYLGYLTLEGKQLTPRHLQAYPWWRFKLHSMWEVGGIKIERTPVCNIFFPSWHRNWRKSDFLGKTLHTRKSVLTSNIRGGGSVLFFAYFVLHSCLRVLIWWYTFRFLTKDMTLVSEGRSYFDEAASANNFRSRPRKHTRPISPPKQLDISFRSISTTHNMAIPIFFFSKSPNNNLILTMDHPSYLCGDTNSWSSNNHSTNRSSQCAAMQRKWGKIMDSSDHLERLDPHYGRCILIPINSPR